MRAISFTTRQFKAGNSQAVRIPSGMAFSPNTELVITRKGNKITVEPVEKTLEGAATLFAELGKKMISDKMVRPKFIDTEREWS